MGRESSVKSGCQASRTTDALAPIYSRFAACFARCRIRQVRPSRGPRRRVDSGRRDPRARIPSAATRLVQAPRQARPDQGRPTGVPVQGGSSATAGSDRRIHSTARLTIVRRRALTLSPFSMPRNDDRLPPVPRAVTAVIGGIVPRAHHVAVARSRPMQQILSVGSDRDSSSRLARMLPARRSPRARGTAHPREGILSLRCRAATKAGDRPAGQSKPSNGPSPSSETGI